MVHEVLYISGVLSSSALGVGVSVWLHSDDVDVSTRLFADLLALHSVVGLLVVGQLLAFDPIVVPIYVVQKAVAAGIMPLWFLFVLAYTRSPSGLSRPALSAIGGYYLILAVLEVTNPLHGLLRSNYETTGSLIPHLMGTTTILYSLLTLPLVLFYFAGLSLVGIHALRGPTVSRQKSAFLFVGFLPPFFVLMAGLYQILPGPVDGGLVILSTSSLAAVAWNVFRRRDFDLIPLARETVFEVVEDAVIVVDDDLRLLDYNDAATEAFARLDGAQGSLLADRIPALVADDGNGDPFATSFTHDDDGVCHYETSVSPLKIGGEIRGYGLVVRDVTENRKYTHDLERQTERLERFASTVSHDIRNPLNVAEGRVTIAMESGDLDHLEDARLAHDRISRIIDDVLELARQGQRIEDPEQVHVLDLFQSAWQMTDTGDATIDIEDGADLVVYADPTRLQRAFENLIRNAVEHGSASRQTQSDDAVEHGTADADQSDGHHASGSDGKVTVSFGRHTNGFYVEDDGPGVSSEERERVFEYEFTTTEEGTGLGLALVEEIARAHGWRVEMGEGTDGGARVVFSNVEPIDTDQTETG